MSLSDFFFSFYQLTVVYLSIFVIKLLSANSTLILLGSNSRK